MEKFEKFWQMLEEHGVIAYMKGEAACAWDALTTEQQQHLLERIRSKIDAGKYVDYNPLRAIKDNLPRLPKQQKLSFNDYYARYGTTEERDGWKMVKPEKAGDPPVYYVKIG